jgi:hypothetical protein
MTTGLEERRLRKRRKREIVKPPSSESATESNTTSKREELIALPMDVSKNSKAEKKKVKLPAGLALMQSFIAPNVGKDRLTVCASMIVCIRANHVLTFCAFS